MKPALGILEHAAEAVGCNVPERDEEGASSLALAAEIFSAVTGTSLTEEDAAVFMLCVKLARSRRGSFNRDDFVDMAGYAAIAGQAAAQAEPPRTSIVFDFMGDDGNR